MDKLNGVSVDLYSENYRKVLELFPDACFDGKINLDILKSYLEKDLDLPEERYGFNWYGKQDAKKVALSQTSATLRFIEPESFLKDKNDNFFIEGDNLEVLKLLQKSYHKKIDVIFIDPPYNTGNEFIYPDKFQESIETYLKYTNQKDDEGNTFSSNKESDGRFHSRWLNMMYPRLLLSRSILADGGIIAVAIDDHEVFQLGAIMDEIFGQSNRLACAPWLSEASGGKEKTGLRTGHEYILIYAKSEQTEVSQEERSVGELNLKDSVGPYRKGRELMKWGGTSLRSDRPNQFYELTTPSGEKVFPYRNDGEEGHWRWGQKNENIIDALDNPDFFHWEMRPFDEGVNVNGKTERWVPYEKIRDAKKTVGWSTWLDKYGTNADATRELKNLFGSKPFDTPKPTSLIKWIIQLLDKDNAVILDFFAGSASVAHAVIEMNKEDKGSRRFLCVQLPEPLENSIKIDGTDYMSVSDIAKERIRRAINAIDSSDGFKVLKLDSSNLKKWDVGSGSNIDSDLFDSISNIKDDRSNEDLVFEILIKYGLDFSVPIDRHQIGDKVVYSIGFGALLICLEKNLSIEEIEKIGKLKESLCPSSVRVVFRDDSFLDDTVKINAIQVLKQFGIEDVKSI